MTAINVLYIFVILCLVVGFGSILKRTVSPESGPFKNGGGR